MLIVTEEDLQAAVCDLLNSSNDVIPGITLKSICRLHSKRRFNAPGEKSVIPDVLVETRDRLIILELKRDLADVQAVAQIRRYMCYPAVKAFAEDRKILSYLVARDLTPEAKEEINQSNCPIEFLRVQGTCPHDLRIILK